MGDNAPANLSAAVIDFLSARGGRARFVPQVSSALRRPDLNPADVEAVLTELELAGAVIVRDNYCADPHLDGIDLRIVALVGAGAEGSDPQANAVAAIEATWQHWVADYLANHRCT